MHVTIIGPMFDGSGYAEAARSIIFALLRSQFMIRAIPRDWSQLDAGLPAEIRNMLSAISGKEVGEKGPIIHIREAQDFHPIDGRYNIGFTMLETDRLPPLWVEKCNRMEQVWVPSTFNMESFLKSGVHPEKLRLVPLSVDIQRFHPNVSPMKGLREPDQFLFITNFEWVPRKGYDILLQAYLEEFSSADPVKLVMKTYDGSCFEPKGSKMRQAWECMVETRNIQPPPAVDFITCGLSFDEIPSFYTAGDIYVIPTRGEGWNLPALEAMSSGIPVIATNWSAHLDFITPENGFLIDIEGLEWVPKYGIPNDEIYDGARWAVPSVASLRKWMRYAFEHRTEVRNKGRLAREDVVLHWNSRLMEERIHGLLRSVKE